MTNERSSTPSRRTSRPWITVTHGMRGFFAVMVDDDGPIMSGIGSYEDSHEARREAREWADAEGMECR